MSRIKRTNISARTRRELEAIDAALADRPLAAEHDSLARFARELRATRPQADEQFLSGLDAKVASGFESSTDDQAPSPARAHGRVRRLLAPPNLSAIPARPALGLAIAALLAIAVALPLALSAGRHGTRLVPRPVSAEEAPVPDAGKVKSAGQAGSRAGVAEPGRQTFTTLQPAPKGSDRLGAASASSAATSSAPPAGAGAPNAPARQVERTATLDVGVAPSAIESKSHQVFTLVSSMGGYVRQSNVSSGGGPAQGGASFDVRVPSANLSNAIAALSGLGHVRSENNTTNDVTDQLNSLQSSLQKLRAERASLLKQLARASEAQEEARLKDRLRYVEAQISQQQGALGALSGRVNYTALALTLTPEAGASSKHGELTPGSAARDAGKILEAALAVLVIAAAALLPLGAIALAAWIMLAGTRRRLREQALDAS